MIELLSVICIIGLYVTYQIVKQDNENYKK